MHELKKTNACRLLDKANIDYEIVAYQVHETDLSAPVVAASLGEPVEQVFKTIVLTGDKMKYFVCVVPGNCEINLKKAARASSNKRCDTLPLKALLPLTGYVRGGCSPVGMKKSFPTFIDVSAQVFPFIYVSAGQRGLQLKIAPEALAAQVKAQFAELTEKEP